MLAKAKSGDSACVGTAGSGRGLAPGLASEAGSTGQDSWIRRLFGRPRYAPEPAPEEHAGLNLSFALQMDLGLPVWLSARGTSMLPWPRPGSELRIEPAGPQLELGTIIVFRRGAKLYYHRIVECIGPGLWRTKGDTLIESDHPVSSSQIIGRVTSARRGSRIRKVQPDPDAAWLSDRLGRCFGGPDRRRTPRTPKLARLAYLALLVSAWPFRNLLARRYSRGRTGAGQIEED